MSDENGPDFTEAGRRLFAREARFFWAAAKEDGLPPEKPAQAGGLEIAFAGRSNVGKSSLINALTGRNALARTSHTPGRTQELNFFDVSGVFSLVDMPGYGFAAVGKEKVSAWTGLIHHYLRGRVALARVFLLIDARHGIKKTDQPIFAVLGQAAVAYQVILTKADELSPAAAAERRAEVAAATRRHAAAHPEILLTSARKGEGIAELRAALARLLFERHAAPEWLFAAGEH